MLIVPPRAIATRLRRRYLTSSSESSIHLRERLDHARNANGRDIALRCPRTPQRGVPTYTKKPRNTMDSAASCLAN